MNQGVATIRRRDNIDMFRVNMVLAEFIELNLGLNKSCGVECSEGIMLEPCLLQPYVHVAGWPFLGATQRDPTPQQRSRCNESKSQ